jgi:hypothetical protein
MVWLRMAYKDTALLEAEDSKAIILVLLAGCKSLGVIIILLADSQSPDGGSVCRCLLNAQAPVCRRRITLNAMI